MTQGRPALGDLEIRPPRPEEFEAVGALTVAAYDADGLLSDNVGYETELRDVARRAEHAELLVAVLGGAVVGTVAVVRPGTSYAEISREGELEFRMLAVDPSARGRGVGAALTQAVLSRARTLGLRRVVLSSLERMHAAHRLYERLDFRRLPARDWQPFPDITLIAYERDL